MDPLGSPFRRAALGSPSRRDDFTWLGLDGGAEPGSPSVASRATEPRRRSSTGEVDSSWLGLDLACIICNKTLKDNRECPSCRGAFDYDCVANLVESGDPKCPQCQKPLPPLQTLIHNAAREVRANQLPHPCPNRCGATVGRNESSIHDLTCPCKVVACEQASLGCTFTGARSLLPEHRLSQCEYRPVACVHGCGLVGPSKEIADHIEVCKVAIVACPNVSVGCNVTQIERGQVAAHVRDTCAFLQSPCPHERFGCDATFLRSGTAQHLEVCPYQKISRFLMRQEVVVAQLTGTVERQRVLLEELQMKVVVLETEGAAMRDALARR